MHTLTYLYFCNLYLYIHTQNIKWSELQQQWFMIPPAEKVARQGSEGIPLPRYFGDLIQYFLKYIRPKLCPASGILAMWINQNGKPVGMCKSLSYLCAP